jgi:hypothetical protein
MGENPTAIDRKLIFILSFLFVFCVASLVVGTCLNSTAAFTISGASLTFFVGFFAVGILDYKIGGVQITLEKRVSNLEQENKELQTAATALIKSLYTISKGAEGYGGPSEEHYSLVSEYLKPLGHLIAPNILKEVDADLAKFAGQNNT